VREAGWGNAMRYLLTGDHWSAEEEIAPTRDRALEIGIKMAEKIAACGPLEWLLPRNGNTNGQIMAAGLRRWVDGSYLLFASS
jgi:hypothetical protein